MKQYTKYKDSGIPWFGAIPAHWKIGKVKHFYRLLTGFTPATKNDTYYDLVNGYDWVTIGDMTSGSIATTKSKISQKYIDEFRPEQTPKGSLLYSFKLSVGQVCFAGKNLYTNEAIASFLTSPDISLEFLSYSSSYIIYNANTNTYGAKILNQDLIRNASIILPPLAEQKVIAEYLDEKCGKIDRMMKQIDKKIALYKRLRRAIITKAVTKGLNPNVSLRHSGVEWIGKIPMHWEVKRFGYLAWIRARLGWKGLKADEYVESGYPFLSAFNIVNDKMNWENLYYINQFRYEESPEIMLHPGDILLVKDGAGIGKCARVDSLPKGESTTNGSLAVITPFETVNYKYIHYFIISDSFNQYKDILINGMGVPHLTQGEMKKMYLPVPPIKDQEEIVEYLDKRCQVIEDSIVKYIKQKELLERYRKALIAQVVTGKRRVCEPSFIYPDTTPISPAMAAEENL